MGNEKKICPLLLGAAYIAKAQGAKVPEERYQCQGERCGWFIKNPTYGTDTSGNPGWCAICNTGGR